MPAEMKSVVGSRWGTSGALGRILCSRLAKCSRKRLRISDPVIRGLASLGGEAFDPPAVASSSPVAQAIVQPVGLVLPELDPGRPQPEAAPGGRRRHPPRRVPALQLLE